jgi:hypothetical protein
MSSKKKLIKLIKAERHNEALELYKSSRIQSCNYLYNICLINGHYELADLIVRLDFKLEEDTLLHTLNKGYSLMEIFKRCEVPSKYIIPCIERCIKTNKISELEYLCSKLCIESYSLEDKVNMLFNYVLDTLNIECIKVMYRTIKNFTFRIIYIEDKAKLFIESDQLYLLPEKIQVIFTPFLEKYSTKLIKSATKII